jgi:hypothetical protein
MIELRFPVRGGKNSTPWELFWILDQVQNDNYLSVLCQSVDEVFETI